MVTNKQIKGKNLCQMECVESNNIIHPETNIDQVMMDRESNINLRSWIDRNHTGVTVEESTSFLNWLESNYPRSAASITPATTETLGGIIVGSNLNITSTGVLSVPIAGRTTAGVVVIGDGLSISQRGVVSVDAIGAKIARYDERGLIQLGSSIPLTVSFANESQFSIAGTTRGNVIYPLKLDENNHAGIEINQLNFSAFTGATSQQNGNKGVVPAPTTSDVNKFLCGNGNWEVPEDSQVFTGATTLSNGTVGLVPAPTLNQTECTLKGDGEWESEKLYNFGYFMCDTHNYLHELEDRIYYILSNAKYQTTINVTLYSPVNVPNSNITKFLETVDSYLMDQFVLRDETKIETMKRSYRFNFEFLTNSVTNNLEFELSDMRAPSFIICVGDLQFTTNSDQRGYLSARCEGDKISKLSIEYQLHLTATGVGIIDHSTSGIIRKYSLTKNDVIYTNHGILPTT